VARHHLRAREFCALAPRASSSSHCKHLAESQLAQLKAQLQPHFLFNALNTISSLMQVDGSARIDC
jgi:LytS/YehU family sensor histidine kinase